MKHQPLHGERFMYTHTLYSKHVYIYSYCSYISVISNIYIYTTIYIYVYVCASVCIQQIIEAINILIFSKQSLLYGVLMDYRASEAQEAADAMFFKQHVLPAGKMEIVEQQVAVASKWRSVDVLERTQIMENEAEWCLDCLGFCGWLRWLA